MVTSKGTQRYRSKNCIFIVRSTAFGSRSATCTFHFWLLTSESGQKNKKKKESLFRPFPLLVQHTSFFCFLFVRSLLLPWSALKVATLDRFKFLFYDYYYYDFCFVHVLSLSRSLALLIYCLMRNQVKTVAFFLCFFTCHALKFAFSRAFSLSQQGQNEFNLHLVHEITERERDKCYSSFTLFSS